MNRALTVVLVAGFVGAVAACGAETRISTADTASPSTTASPATPPTSTVPDTTEPVTSAPATAPATAVTAEVGSPAGSLVIPLIPTIVVPDVTSFGEGEQAITEALGEYAAPFEGLGIADARCADDGTVFASTSLTTFGDDGSTVQVGDAGAIEVDADGSGSIVFDGGVITVNGDGSGLAVTDDAVVEVQTDLSGTYVGVSGTIELNNDGSGLWVGDNGVIEIGGDGSGSWTGARGVVENAGDGSGSWVADASIVINNGDGTGTVDGAAIAMAPLPLVPPVGTFRPVADLVPVGASCGTVITLGDEVLFDFDKADLRPEAAPILDEIAAYLVSTGVSIQINGHTDAIGTDEYNQGLSERRADAVWAALQSRGVVAAADVRGFGETQPVAPNDNPDGSDNPSGRQLNRRVEIIIFD
jgi:OmpA-OmpF porin, OOP family